MLLNVAYDFLPKERSLNTSLVMDHFGIDFEQGRHVIAQDLELDIRPGDVVFFTGPSGSGKSSLLRACAEALEREGVLWIDHLDLPARPLADALPLPVKHALDLLSACGLGEAHLLLRTPRELSDGQRYRFRLALGIAQLGFQPSTICQNGSPSGALPIAGCRQPIADRWLVADEFSAALDRTLAKVLAFNLRRLARRTGVGFLLATTHEDILADLDPDVLVRCGLDGRISVFSDRPSAIGQTEEKLSDAGRKPRADRRKQRRAISFFPGSGSARAPAPIGRTSLGGITAATH